MKFDIRLDLYGKNFYPSLAEKDSGIIFKRKREIGQISYIGKRLLVCDIAYASINVEFSPNDYYPIVLDKFIDFIQDKVSIFRKHGAEEMILYVGVFYRFQCNLEVDNDLVKRVADLGFHVALSCYYDPDLSDEWDPEFIPLDES